MRTLIMRTFIYSVHSVNAYASLKKKSLCIIINRHIYANPCVLLRAGQLSALALSDWKETNELVIERT